MHVTALRNIQYFDNILFLTLIRLKAVRGFRCGPPTRTDPVGLEQVAFPWRRYKRCAPHARRPEGRIDQTLPGYDRATSSGPP